MLERLRHMLIKEFIQIFRDPRMKTVIFITPIIQMLVFGYAVNTDVDHVSTAVYDLDHSATSRDLLARFQHSRYFDVETRARDEDHLTRLLDHGDVLAVLRINKGFEEDVRAGRTARFQVLVDGTDSNTARIVVDYSSRIARQYSLNLLDDHLVRVVGAVPQRPQVELETRAWFNANLVSRNFYVPGVIGLLVMVITILLTSMAVVREKEMGTMEQVMVSPIRPSEFILGKTLPFALLGFFDVILISIVAVFWFDVPIRGNPLVLLGSAGLYLMSTLGVGLFISTISHTQQQAMMTAFFFIMPAVLLSGFVFPIRNMPEAIQWITYLDPMRYFLVIIRGVFLKGVGVDVLWPQMAALFILGSVTLWLTTQRFQKSLA